MYKQELSFYAKFVVFIISIYTEITTLHNFSCRFFKKLTTFTILKTEYYGRR